MLVAGRRRRTAGSSCPPRSPGTSSSPSDPPTSRRHRYQDVTFGRRSRTLVESAGTKPAGGTGSRRLPSPPLDPEPVKRHARIRWGDIRCRGATEVYVLARFSRRRPTRSHARGAATKAIIASKAPSSPSPAATDLATKVAVETASVDAAPASRWRRERARHGGRRRYRRHPRHPRVRDGSRQPRPAVRRDRCDEADQGAGAVGRGHRRRHRRAGHERRLRRRHR